MTPVRRIAALATATVAGLAPLAVVAPSPAATAPTVTNGCIDSRAEPGTSEPVRICYTLFRPAGATSAKPVPMVMHSHGWGGQRTRDAASFAPYLQRGMGVLSFDQRSFGESTGTAHVQNPLYEGHDVRRLVDLVARLPWVRKDAPGDPRLGAIGGSYGGGFQFLGAFELLRIKGKPVFDALAPEITWWDLKESLAPDEVVRTEWALALSAAGARNLPPSVLKSITVGTASGQWPKGEVPGTEDMDAFFAKNGPSYHVRNGRRLDIPVLFGQGATDNLFPLRQGLKNWANALTPNARKRSIFVGYNGGHTLPSVFPGGVGVAGDPCSMRLGSPTFSDLAVRWMANRLQGRDTGLRGFGRYHLATAGGSCVSTPAVAPTRTVDVGRIATTSALGVPIATEVARGPIRVAGRTFLSGRVTTIGPDARAFYALAVGRTPLDAKIVQNNMLPLREPTAVKGVQRRLELPSVAVHVPAGQRLFLVASPIQDLFLGMSSRTPGLVTFESARLELPVR